MIVMMIVLMMIDDDNDDEDEVGFHNYGDAASPHIDSISSLMLRHLLIAS